MPFTDDECLWIDVFLNDCDSWPSFASPTGYAEVVIAEFMTIDLLAMLGKRCVCQDDVLWADVREEVSARKNDIIAWASEIAGRASARGAGALALRFRLDPKTTAVMLGQVVFGARPMDR